VRGSEDVAPVAVDIELAKLAADGDGGEYLAAA
jgi:hypothetical protein